MVHALHPKAESLSGTGQEKVANLKVRIVNYELRPALIPDS
jgi:hypothetical protein